MINTTPVTWRHEDKYSIHEVEMALIGARLHGLLHLDAHMYQKEYYHISSLYFDDWKNSAFYQTVDGVDDRSKYRIRRYESGALFLEEKQKSNGLTHKESSPISSTIAAYLASGGLLSFSEAFTPSLRRFALLQRTERLRPVVIVDYDRTAYVADACTVRVTFDQHIAASSQVANFLSAPSFTPVMPTGEHMLEVKYDGILPDYIAQVLRTGKMQTVSFSKYTMSRNVTIMPIRKDVGL